MKDVPADTGNAEADRLIRRLMSSDPDFDDCADAAALIRRLARPDPAVCAHGIHRLNACGSCIPPRGTSNALDFPAPWARG